MFLISLPFLQLAVMQEIKLECLDDGPGILPFKIGSAKLFSHYHSFVQPISLRDLRDRINSVSIQLESVTPELHTKTNSLLKPHITFLKNKIEGVSHQLETFEKKRTRRGILDALGSIIKSITGNLDYTDALIYNQALKNIKNNENRLNNEINSHISVSKDWMIQYSKVIDTIVDNQRKLEILVKNVSEADATKDNDLIKYAHLAQVLVILSDNMDLVYQEVSKLENILAFIKISIAHHSLLSIDTIDFIINRLDNLYGTERTVKLDYREYYDIVKLGYYYTEDSIVIVLKFPIVLPPLYDYYKLAIIPNRYNKILSPITPYLVIHQKDFRYIEAECPKTSKLYLCEENPHLQSKTPDDCIQKLITTQRSPATCHSVNISVENPAYELLDERHYSIIFPKPTKVHLSCEQDLYKTLQGSFLAIIAQKCYLETEAFTLLNVNDHLKGQALKLMDISKTEIATPSWTPTIKLNSINLSHLHTTNSKISLQQPVPAPDDSTNYFLYHTTIPIYTIIISTGGLITGLVLYRYLYQKRTRNMEITSKDTQPELQRVYAVPLTTRKPAVEPPAQFTTKVFNSRCSTGGGVTQS
jgi:hypothetical protein